MPIITKEERQFLRESNAIEQVYDDASFEQAVTAWRFLLLQDKLTIGVILKTHKILMLNQLLRPDEKGYFRKRPVYINNIEALNYEKIEETIILWVMNVMDVVESGKKESHIFLEKVIKEQHVAYEHIHPFIDGNGRTGRMFMNWQRRKLGMPIMVIKEGERFNYYRWF